MPNSALPLPVRARPVSLWGSPDSQLSCGNSGDFVWLNAMPGAGLSCRPLWAPLLHPFPQADFRWLFPKAKATRDGAQSQCRTARRGNVHLMYYAFGHGLIELSQMILARSEDTKFARRQHGVMARSLIIAHAHCQRHRHRQRQAAAPLILIEIDSFSGLPGEGEQWDGGVTYR